jgi:hypothetical protein
MAARERRVETEGGIVTGSLAGRLDDGEGMFNLAAMPLLDSIVDELLREVFLAVFYGIGWVSLKVGSLGMLKLEPYGRVEKKRSGRKWYQPDFSLWVEVPGRGRCVKGDVVALFGLMVVAGVVGVLVMLKGR